MEIRENMYVRTKNGYIAKICNINDFREPSTKYGIEANYLPDIYFIGDEDIKIGSFDITELVEKGDYVNGEKVIALEKDVDKRNIYFSNKGAKIFTYYELQGNWYFGIQEEDIKSIVTHERFENMKYEVNNGE